MFLRTQRTILRTRSKLYIKVLVFLSMLSVPALFGCSGQDKAKEQKRIDDSIENARLLKLEREKTITDSLAKAEKEKVRIDSIAKAKVDSTAKAKQNNITPIHPKPKYGVPANDWTPQAEPAKYGVPSDFRDQ